MNLLFISPNSPTESIGGVERYISNLIGYCKNQTLSKVTIILPTFGENRREEIGSVSLVFDKSIALSKDASRKELSQKVQDFSKTVEKIIVEKKIDIICAENIHVGLPPAFNLMLNMVTGLYHLPLVLRLHSFASTELQIELVNQLMWKKISCVSKSVAGDCFQKGADINILSTDYLGVNTEEFKSVKTKNGIRQSLGLSPKNKIVLTATRILHGRKSILKEKGIINLVQAFSKLSPRYPDLRLVIAIGRPPNNLMTEFDQAHRMLLGYLKLNNVEDKTIVKMLELNEMADMYRESDVFTLPSENETFGQVFIEAMSCGVPVIGTETGGIPEIISDSYNGYLIPPNDSSILAQKIEKLLNDRATRNKFIKAGLKTVKDKFTSEKQFFNFLRGLEETKA